MTAASTMEMSWGWIAVGPPATGTCHTIVTYGVAEVMVPLGQGGEPAVESPPVVADEPPDGTHTSVRWCHCTREPYGIGGAETVLGNR